MKKSLISSLIAVAILCSGSTVAFASPQNTNSKQNVTVETAEEPMNPTVKANHDNLTYAIDEMKEAGNLFETADFTKPERYERMVIFARTSLDRIRSLDIYNNPENWSPKTYSWAADAQNNIAWIEEEGNKINDATYRITRIEQALDNVKAVFKTTTREGKESRENKENVINTLNLVLTQEVKAGVINQTTLRKAVSIMHEYNNKLNGNTIKLKEAKIDAATIKYNHDHLGYAIEEMREAGRLLENADFTQIVNGKDDYSNYDRMIIFAKSSLDRVRSLDIYNNPENWSAKTYSWAKDAQNNMSWIEEESNKITDATYRINRVNQAIDNVKSIFKTVGRDGKESNENKENVLNSLNTVINQEKEAGVVNNTTLTAATKIMDQYKALIK